MCDEPRGRAPVALNAASDSEQRVRSRKGKALVALNAAAKPYSTLAEVPYLLQQEEGGEGDSV